MYRVTGEENNTKLCSENHDGERECLEEYNFVGNAILNNGLF